MAEHSTLTVVDRRDGDRRSLDLRTTAERRAADRRAGERRDVAARPSDLAADDVLIDLRDGAATVRLLPDVDVVLARRWFLLVVLGALNLLDLVTTRLVLAAGGEEANPLMAPIIHHPFAPALVKTAGFAAMAMVLKACPPRSAVVDRALVGVTGLYLGIVGWNLLNLLVHA